MTRKTSCVTAIIALYMLCVSSVWAQPPQAASGPAQGFVTRVVDIKYVDPFELRSVLDPFTMAGPNVRIMPNGQLRTMTLSGGPDIVAAMEAVIRKLDVASAARNIELTVYLLAASDSASGSANTPPALEPALKQMRSTFAYKSYQLLDSVIMRANVGSSHSEAGTSGFIPHPALPEKRIPYMIRFGRSALSHDETGDRVQLSGFSLSLDMTEYNDKAGSANPRRTMNSGISTNMDIRVGQMAVIGKTNFEVGNSALIAILSAKVVD